MAFFSGKLLGFKKTIIKREFTVLLLGLEKAGKTTALFKLKNNPICNLIPTIFCFREIIKHENVTFIINEVSGRDTMRPLWRHFFKGVKAIIFFIDSNDKERMEEAKQEIKYLLEEDQLKDLPLLILANKRDLPESLTVREITKILGNVIDDHSDRCCIQASCAKSGEGLKEGLEWLKVQLTQNRRKSKRRHSTRC